MRITHFIGFLVVFLLSGNTQAAVVWEKNFDSNADWHSQQTTSDIGWSMTNSTTCTTHCPPEGFSDYSASRTKLVTDTLDTYNIESTTEARGGSGKCIIYNAESVTSDWTGGHMAIWLDGVDYEELYVGQWVKFESDFEWYNPEHPQNHLHKMLRIHAFTDGSIYTTTKNPQIVGESLGYNVPAFLGEWGFYASNPQNGCYESSQFRSAPDYTPLDTITNVNAGIPEDGQWHFYEYHVKMSTPDGTANGEFDLWIDGVLKTHRTDILYRDTASLEVGWNYVWIADNMYNNYGDDEDNIHQQIYIDDVVISTTYIGTDYVIGDTPVTYDSPTLTGPVDSSTTSTSVEIEGTYTVDPELTVDTVTWTLGASSGFAVAVLGVFSCTVPVELGTNNIVFRVVDSNDGEDSDTTVVTRTFPFTLKTHGSVTFKSTTLH